MGGAVMTEKEEDEEAGHLGLVRVKRKFGADKNRFYKAFSGVITKPGLISHFIKHK